MADTLDEFAVAARAYCSWCEEPDGDVAKAFRLVSLLVAAIVDVPRGKGGNAEVRDISSDEQQRVYDKLRALPLGLYKVHFNPHNVYDTPNEIGDLLSDLSETWADVKEGLVLFDAGHRAEAAWQWHFLFHAHWGRHATGAMYALHSWLADR